MLSIPFITILLAAGGMCAPLYPAQEASTGALSTIEERRVTRWSTYCSDRTDPSTCKTTTTTDGEDDGQRRGGGRRRPSKAQVVPVTDSNDSNANVETAPTDEEETTPVTPPTASNPPTGNTGSGSIDENAMLTVINKWRSAYGLDDLSWSADMVAGAAKTGQDNNGQGGPSFNHGGSGNAEVMTPGFVNAGSQDTKGYSPFEVAYIVGWLCEVPVDPVASDCANLKGVLNIDHSGGNTGHHDILVDPKYKEIGCAFTQGPNASDDGMFQGLWICNLQL
ncbi:MAG: hypothetical protein Q9221_005115 [Calogaya cf. arnoldii]